MSESLPREAQLRIARSRVVIEAAKRELVSVVPIGPELFDLLPRLDDAARLAREGIEADPRPFDVKTVEVKP